MDESHLFGVACIVGIILYWYFIPYQCFLALQSSNNLLGLVIANTLLVIATGIIGAVLTIVLGIIVLAILTD